MKPIILLLVLFGAMPEISIGQVNQAQADDLSKLFDTLSCGGNFQSGKKVCEIVLPRSVDAKRNKTGEHIVNPADKPGYKRQQMLKSLISNVSTQRSVEARSGANGGSVLRIRIDKGVRKDGREIPVEARIVALASQSSVTEGWQFPAIIVDRFPRTPEDDQRLPGEKKLSEDQPDSSLLDSTAEIPVHYRVVCLNKEMKALADACTNLPEARGVYGYNKLTLEPAWRCVLARRICAQFQEEHRITCRDCIGSGTEERSTVILKCCKDPEPALAPLCLVSRVTGLCGSTPISLCR